MVLTGYRPDFASPETYGRSRTLGSTETLEWSEAYAQMAAETSEADEWNLWGGVTGDGLDD
ncbi:MAG: hypothetical protein EA383_17425 [Spirochaetaceae bacterium]|nr:MAG: hypothetical protein EA383_17425 [Spirochaetaceae bacterium]